MELLVQEIIAKDGVDTEDDCFTIFKYASTRVFDGDPHYMIRKLLAVTMPDVAVLEDKRDGYGVTAVMTYELRRPFLEFARKIPFARTFYEVWKDDTLHVCFTIKECDGWNVEREFGKIKPFCELLNEKLAPGAHKAITA